MAVAGERPWLMSDTKEEDKVLSLCKIPFWQSSSTTTTTSTTGYGGGGGGGVCGGSATTTTTTSFYHSSSQYVQQRQMRGNGEGQNSQRCSNRSHVTVSSIAKSLLPPRRRLRVDPSNKLFFPYEPGKQVRSAITIKNICKSHVAFKFQTTAPKSCYMRPPGGVLAPGETLVAIVFKFVEPPESNEGPVDQKSRVKFKIMSLKVNGDQLDYIPELAQFLFLSLFAYLKFEEQRDQVSVEQILRVVFIDAERPTPALEKLKRQLAEADASVETRRKPQQEAAPQIGGEGLVIYEWKERRERYLAQQNGEVPDSL